MANIVNNLLMQKNMENLIYLYMISHPTISLKELCIIWDRDKTLREYKQPKFDKLREVFIKLKEEIQYA